MQTGTTELSEEIARWPDARIAALCERTTPRHVETALAAETRTLHDLAALWSPAARPYLEPMAREAQRLTRKHFGRTIALYAPIYLSNLCAADCVYCGFSARSGIHERRVTLREAELRKECAALAAQGFASVLLLTGEAPKIVTPAYIAACIGIAREYFASVSVEVYAVAENDYRRFVHAGLEGVTLYMETYDRAVYRQVHLLGQKADYDYRLDALDRAGRAGARKLNIGVLLGLADWRSDLFRLALHARHLQRECWQSALAVSFPRLLHVPPRYRVARPVSDTDLVQAILGLRLFLPEVAFNLSTRERPALRDRLIPLGITHMSAGSSTQPGGYAAFPRGTTAARDDGEGHRREVLEQFAIEDHRSVREVASAIRRAGYDPVWKDYDRAFDCA